MKNLEIKNVDCHATLAMIEKRWGFPRRTLRALLGMTENTQSGRSPLAERGADAPQSGRSMIEMLGVLAIIGVLSVGGIAGYSKAMQKYRINKAIEQITLIAGNVRAFFAPQKNYEGLDYCEANDHYMNGSCKLIKKAKLMPDEMWDDIDYAFKNVFGYKVDLYTAHKSTNADKQAFRINYEVDGSYEVCIELLSYDWGEAGVTAIQLNDGPPYRASKPIVPISIETATNICPKQDSLVLDFYFDVNSNCWSETNGNTCS